jgi:hypothetical protein
MTVHKSQGITLDEAFMDLNGAFVEGQGYVAISRVRTLAGLHLAGYNDKALAVHPVVLEQDKVFRQLSDETDLTHGNLIQEELTKSHADFIVNLGGNVQSEKKHESEKEFDEYPVFDRDPKESKEERWNKSLRLISEGRTIAEVSQLRGRTEGTIIQHLEDLKALSKLSADQIAHLKTEVGDSTVSEIQNAFIQFGVERLKPIFDHFEGRHSYKSIRLARLLMLR